MTDKATTNPPKKTTRKIDQSRTKGRVMREKFAIEYLDDFNATKAAIRAGYSKRSAAKIGYELLRREDVQELIQDEKLQRLQRLRIDKDYVLMRAISIDQMDAADIFDEDCERLLPLSQWPSVWRQFISGLDVYSEFAGSGDEREQVGIMRKIKWPDKVKNLELIGKHVDVAAWDKDVNHTHKFEAMTIDELLQETLKDG